MALSETARRTLADQARAATAQAYVPYSRRPTAAVALLSDGRWIPGVRIENASFPLTIPAVLNVYSTAVACGRTDVVAVAHSRSFSTFDRAYLTSLFANAPELTHPDFFLTTPATLLPEPGDPLDPFLDAPAPGSPAEGLALARQAATRAEVHQSHFPVGAVLETEDGRLIPGCNVEHEEWLYTLCAERNALSTAVSYGIDEFRRLYLTCPKDPGGTPCGACRQVLTEHAPDLLLHMDRGQAMPAAATAADLLPHYFRGNAIRVTNDE